MTATPIPRTLVLTYFGDMDISELREKPAGRQPIDTRTVPLDRLDEVDRRGRPRARRRPAGLLGLPAGRGIRERAISPPPRNASPMLQQRFGAAVDLVHGRMKGAEKDAAMARFAAGETRLLVATTVIEVGVDVPEATVMVIEHAERFGLAQLHQLRGRIGRGSGALDLPAALQARRSARPPRRGSRSCARPRTASASPRRICGCAAKATCSARGRAACRASASRRIEVHGKLLEAARDDAALMLARDPELTSPRGEALRHLLYLFERDEAIRLLRAG